MRTFLTAGFCLLLAALEAGSSDGSMSRLTTTTDLTGAPDGERVGILLPGTVVRVLETREGWTRVSVEGWLRGADLPGGAATGLGTVQPPAAERAAGRITGAIFVSGPGSKTAVGAAIAVRLVGGSAAAFAEIEEIRASCLARRQVLLAEAAALKDKAGRAMKTTAGTSQAFEAYDEAMREREQKLKEARSLDRECSTRINGALDAVTVAKTLSTSDGRYLLEGVLPGTYEIHAALESDGVLHSWQVRTVVEPGAQLTVDLTESNRARREEIPVYR